MKFSTSIALLSIVAPLLVAAAPMSREHALLARQTNQDDVPEVAQVESAEELEAAADLEVVVEEAEEEAAANDNVDPQTSLTIDLEVLAAGFVDDGVGGFNGFNAATGELNPPFEGIASLISVNNFINFCVGETITDGKQIAGGSCNPCPIGQIPNIQTMPVNKFIFPLNFDTESIQADTNFEVQVATNNMETGVAANLDTNFMAAPQQLNDQGEIIGHTFIQIEELDGLDQTAPLNSAEPFFVQAITGAPSASGVQTLEIEGGLPAGDYRACTYSVTTNGTPVIAPVAQHGSHEDCVYFTVN